MKIELQATGNFPFFIIFRRPGSANRVLCPLCAALLDLGVVISVSRATNLGPSGLADDAGCLFGRRHWIWQMGLLFAVDLDLSLSRQKWLHRFFSCD